MEVLLSLCVSLSCLVSARIVQQGAGRRETLGKLSGQRPRLVRVIWVT